jgi:hypothetical protein
VLQAAQVVVVDQIQEEQQLVEQAHQDKVITAEEMDHI